MPTTDDKYKILLVDDEEEFLAATSQALVRRGMDVDVAPNGVTAIEMVNRKRYDVVVLDVRMPDIDGIEVFGIIRSKQPGLPVIMLTGHASIDEAFQTSRNGIADYLTKPIDMDDLAARVRQVVVQSQQHRRSEHPPVEVVGLDAAIRVMLIDDEAEFLDSMNRVLRRRNMEVVTAASGEEALALLKENLADVVVLDVKMPGMDGLGVLKRIKRRHPSVQVIMLTGHPSLEAAMESVKLGANEYLKKPPDLDQLVAAIYRLFECRQDLLERQRAELIENIRNRFPV